MDILKEKDGVEQLANSEEKPDQVLVPEIAKEVVEQSQTQERAPESDRDQQTVAEPSSQVVVAQAHPPMARLLDPLEQKIEGILEEDMTDLFLAMSQENQQKFKEKGEETASKIRELLSQTKVQTKKIFELIRAWLKLIPGVNRFFLEQEAKIKTDKIKQLSEQKDNTL